jgi:hypothetical protein
MYTIEIWVLISQTLSEINFQNYIVVNAKIKFSNISNINMQYDPQKVKFR